MAALSAATGRLQLLGFPVVETDGGAIELLEMIASERSQIANQLGEAKREADGLVTWLSTTIETPQTGSQGWREWLSKSREQLVSTEALQVKLDAFASAFPWPSAAPLAELVIEVELMCKVVVDLQIVLA